MLSKKWYALAAVVVVGSVLLAACGQPTEVIRTVEITVPPEEIIVEVEKEVEKIVEVEKEVEVEKVVEVEVEKEVAPGMGAGCNYNAYRMGWVMDYADAENMLNVVFHPDSPFQYTFWDDDNFRDLVDQAIFEFDFDTRMALWQEAENIMMTDYAAVAPVYHYDRTSVLRPDIEAVYPPFGTPPIKQWRMPAGETEIVWVLGTEPPTMDVSQATDTTSHLLLHQTMDQLFEYDGDGRVQPSGAVSYEVSDDGTVYTVKLREGATWSDGELVVAQHYVDGLIRLLEPATAAEYAWLMYPILGSQAFNTGETDDPSTVGVRAIDDMTLEIELEAAASYFDTVLAFSTTQPVRLDVIEQYGELWWEPGNFVGNGAYLLTEWAHNDYVVLEKNPDYWGADDVTIEKIELPIITEQATALAAYERGELDVLADWYPSEEVPRILEDMPEHFRRLPRPGSYYIGLNMVRPPTDNLNMRKALASAIDKRAILDNVLSMPWRIDACGVVPPEIPGYQGCGSVGYEFDVEAAQGYLQAALDEMGMEAGDISVNLWYNRGNEDILDAVAEQWETNLGINVNVAIMDWAAYLETLDQCNN